MCIFVVHCFALSYTASARHVVPAYYKYLNIRFTVSRGFYVGDTRG